MNKPTEAQIKEFWEWCGVEPHPIYPTGVDYPSIDLNNLFKWGITELRRRFGNHAVYQLLVGWAASVANGENPASALFWALWQVKEKK